MPSGSISRVYLPKLADQPATILEFLAARFPQVPHATWLDRIERGRVCTLSGRSISALSPYAHGLTVTYYRENEGEPIVPFAESIVYRDAAIIVADKPHFLPVTPGGPFVDECLLERVKRSTGLRDIVPAHRLDRDTAGIVLLVINPRDRAAFHRLFETASIIREYVAVATVPKEPVEREWLVENRMAAGEPWYRQAIVAGEVNSITRIELIEWNGGLGMFRLFPSTGRKHQLRVHMASLGYPIVNDPLYPIDNWNAGDDYSRPMQLLAKRLSFVDPLNARADSMVFESARTLRDER